MLKHKLLLMAGLMSVAMLSACSNDKVLPQGTRISVLDQTALLKPDVLDGSEKISVPPAVPSGDWLQTDMNAQHKIPNIKIATDFAKQWSVRFGKGSSKRDFLISKPLVKGQVVYTLDAGGKLSAFNLQDGEKLWAEELVANNKNVGDMALKGVGLAMVDSTIYITTGFGVVVAASAKDGHKIWEQNLHVPLRITPLATADKIFVQSVDNRFYALNQKDGDVLWDYDIAMEDTTIIGGAIAAYSPDFDVIVTGFSNGEIQSFNASIGSPLWSDILIANSQAYSSTFLHTIKASPVIDGDFAYVLGCANVMAAVDIRSGMRKWDKEIGGMNTPLLVGDILYVVTNNNELTALDKETGDVLWTSSIELSGKASEVMVYAPIMVNGKVLVTTSNGHVLLFDPKTGTMLKNVDLDEDFNSAPIVANGYILFVTDNAKLLAYK